MKWRQSCSPSPSSLETNGRRSPGILRRSFHGLQKLFVSYSLLPIHTAPQNNTTFQNVCALWSTTTVSRQYNPSWFQHLHMHATYFQMYKPYCPAFPHFCQRTQKEAALVWLPPQKFAHLSNFVSDRWALKCMTNIMTSNGITSSSSSS